MLMRTTNLQRVDVLEQAFLTKHSLGQLVFLMLHNVDLVCTHESHVVTMALAYQGVRQEADVALPWLALYAVAHAMHPGVSTFGLCASGRGVERSSDLSTMYIHIYIYIYIHTYIHTYMYISCT
jgi:hypothetical protein